MDIILIIGLCIIIVLLFVVIVLLRYKRNRYDCKLRISDGVNAKTLYFVDESDRGLVGFNDNTKTRVITKKEKSRQIYLGLDIIITDLQTNLSKETVVKDKMEFGRTNVHNSAQFYTAPYNCISKVHCALFTQGDNVCVQDMGSKNGTYVNGKRVDNYVYVGSKFELGLGSAKFIIEIV